MPGDSDKKTISVQKDAEASSQEKTADSKPQFKKHRAFEAHHPEQLKGARPSLINPKLQAMVLHEKSRMRIAKIFILITVVMLIVLGIYVSMHHFQVTDQNNSHIHKELARLNTIDNILETKTGYEAAINARNGIRIAEMLMNYAATDNQLVAELKGRVSYYENVLNGSYPTLTGPGETGENFVAKSAMLDMVYIPAGEFYMGRSDKERFGGADELPRRKVTIGSQFWIARTEVDMWQLRKLIPGYRVEPWNGFIVDGLRQPVTNLKWHNALAYCQKLTEMERKAGRLPDGYEYRLPTEAEWEYACRAGTNTIYYWGDVFDNVGAKYANSLDKRSAERFGWRDGPFMANNDGYYVSAPVGSYKPNAFGLYDMSGNLWEWCFDWYHPQAYLDSVTPAHNPVQVASVAVVYKQQRGFSSDTFDMEIPCKVIRGGSWGNLPADLRSAKRDFLPPNSTDTGIGFRPVLAPKIPTRTRN